jgi:hypothetical protein
VCTTRVAIFASRWRRVGRAQQPPRRVCVCVCRDTHTPKGQKLLCDGDDADKRTQYSRYGYFLHSNVYNATPTAGLQPTFSRSITQQPDIIRRVAIAFCLCVCVLIASLLLLSGTGRKGGFVSWLLRRLVFAELFRRLGGQPAVRPADVM